MGILGILPALLSIAALVFAIIAFVQVKGMRNRLRGPEQPYGPPPYQPGQGQWGPPPQNPYGPR
jgi:hypothetical protein